MEFLVKDRGKAPKTIVHEPAELVGFMKSVEPVLTDEKLSWEFSGLFELLELKLGDTIVSVPGTVKEQVQLQQPLVK